MTLSFTLDLSEATLRLMFFLTALALFWSLEWLLPRRAPGRRWPRQLNNLLLAALGILLTRLVMPWLAIDAAGFAQDASLGLLAWSTLPGWVAFAAALILLDAAIYFQHRLFHLLPWAWRLHRVHHVDRAFDVTTGLRFHPLEILLSMIIKIGVVLLIGAPPAAVLVFEIVLNATSIFNHANIRIPKRIDRVLRWFIVTPDMHRVHHSVHPSEQLRNFGFNLSLWDRLLATYCAQPRDGHKAMLIGMADQRGDQAQQLGAMLKDPLRPLAP